MVNSSLTYEILMYLNSFYFGMFATCEIGEFRIFVSAVAARGLMFSLSFSTGMMTLKAVNLQYDDNKSPVLDACVLIGLCILESIRVHLGKKGSLSDYGWQVILSVFITIPCAAGVIFLVWKQSDVLKLEYILCALMLLLQITELFFATLFLFSLCKQPTYE
jgi:transmembrane protein 216